MGPFQASVRTTDLPDEVSHREHPQAERGKLVRGLPRIHLHQGDGLDTSLELWRASGRKPRPMFFVDGDHAYESVLRELTGIADEVPDAAVLIHDAFCQSPESGYNIGPYQAIEAVMANWPGRYRKQRSGLGLPGLTLLYPPSLGGGRLDSPRVVLSEIPLALATTRAIRAIREDDILDIGAACIVFSKDRPLQLDATLRSLKLNFGDLRSSTIRVLYTTSSPFFAAQYDVLANEHRDVVFVREASFKPDLVELVEGSAHVLFLVDDTLVVGPLSLARTIQALDDDPACLGFSLRLGRNTTYCYTLDQPQRLPAFEALGSGVLSFDWTEAEYDFGYPIEVSSSIYRSSDLLPLLLGLDYRNPNTLESVLAARAPSFKRTRPRLACYEQSVALSVPANIVQTAWGNRVGGNPELTIEALSQAFGRGQRLDVERYQGFVASACHQELEFAFKSNPHVPAVSVIIPCYGQAQYLPDAVASVVAQTFTDWEIVIVDDGSPDDTARIALNLIEENPHHRIHLLRQGNAGLSNARNNGIAFSTGRYILPLDADDMIRPQMLEQTVAALEADHSAAIAYTDQQYFGATSAVIRLKEYEPDVLARANLFGYCSLYRRGVWDAVRGYNPNMELGYEDWDFWVGAAEAGFRARRVPEPLFCYRVKETSMYSRARVHHSQLAAQIRANHPAFFAPLVSIITPTFERHQRADLDFTAGRAALRESRRSDAEALFRSALRTGSARIRFKAVLGLGCSYTGFDLERIADIADRVRGR